MKPSTALALATLALVSAALMLTLVSVAAYAAAPPRNAMARQDAELPCSAPCPTPTLSSSATITIESAQLDVGAIDVVGMAAGLTANQLTVAVRDSGRRVLDQQTVVLDAPLGSPVIWRATLHPNAPPWTRVYAIQASAPSPVDGAPVVDYYEIDTYRGPIPMLPTPQPALTIDRPTPGSIVSPEEIIVDITDVSLHGSTVVVRALDAEERVLDEQVAAFDGYHEDIMHWRAILHPHATPGAAGRIHALMPTPGGDPTSFEDSAPVTYGAVPNVAQPSAPFVVIDRPVDGITVTAAQGFRVQGRSQGPDTQNIVVRVTDAYSHTIAEQTTAAVDGRWEVDFGFLIANGAAGSIDVYVLAPGTVRPLTGDRVNVQFATPCHVRSSWPAYHVAPGDTLDALAERTGATVAQLVAANCLPLPALFDAGQTLYVPRSPDKALVAEAPSILIETPTTDNRLSANVPFSVTGVADGVPLDAILVRVLDESGQVLGESHAAPLGQPAAGERWPWSADLLIPAVPPGSRTTILAYALSSVDDHLLATDILPVVIGDDERTPMLVIEEPWPYSQLDLSKPILVRGRGRALTESNVEVQALDSAGRVLAAADATVKAAANDDESEWSAELPVDAVQRGRIIVFVRNPGQTWHEAEAAVDVRFGDPSHQADSVTIRYPLPETVYTNRTPELTLRGQAYGRNGGPLTLVMQGQNGEILSVAPVTVDPQSGQWSWTTSLPTIEKDDTLRVDVVKPGPLHAQGAPPAADRIDVRTQAHDALLTGAVVYLDSDSLPEHDPLPGEFIVRLFIDKMAPGETPSNLTLLGAQEIHVTDAKAPIPFAVGYNSSSVDPTARYVMSARIENSDRRVIAMSQEIPVLTLGNPVHDVKISILPTMGFSGAVALVGGVSGR